MQPEFDKGYFERVDSEVIDDFEPMAVGTGVLVPLVVGTGGCELEIGVPDPRM